MLPKLKSKYLLRSIDLLSSGGCRNRAREVLTKRVNVSHAVKLLAYLSFLFDHNNANFNQIIVH